MHANHEWDIESRLLMIEHEGIVEQIKGNHITVRILQQSACSACHAKGYCTAADASEKIVDVTDNTGQFYLNERVMVQGSESMGYKAVLWAYVFPLLLVLLTVILATAIWHLTETQGALAAILSLIPYYILLYLLKNKMTKKFTFTIKKIH